MPIDLMPQVDVAGIPGFSIAITTVTISVDKDEQEAYFLSKAKNEAGEQLYALRKRGAYKFIRAAGVNLTESKTWRPYPDQPLWKALYAGEWMETDGSIQRLEAGDKEWDLRVGGTRWAEHRLKELEFLLKNEGKSKLKLSWPTGASTTDYATLVTAQITGERLQSLIDIAESRATRQVVRQAQFGSELASTGAIIRLLMRIMNLKHAYTEAQYADGFIVKRVNINYEQMKAAIGEDAARARIGAMMDRALGLEPGEADRVLIPRATAPEIEEEPPIEVEIVEEEIPVEAEIVESEETTIEVIAEEPVPEEKEAIEEKAPEEFSMPISQETMEWIIENHETAAFATTQGMLMYLLDKPDLKGLTEGEGLNVKSLISEVAMAVLEVEPTVLRHFKTETRAKLRELNKKHQLWEKNDESAKELSE